MSGEIVRRGDPSNDISARRIGNEQGATYGVGLNPEITGLSRPRLRVFADFGSGAVAGETGRQITDHLRILSQVDASRDVVQAAVSGVTREILSATFDQQPRDDVLLVPVLRAGLAMWGEANAYFGVPETSFLMGQKEKGTNRATVVWAKKNELDGKQVVILDPIIATGDTLIEVCKGITDSFPTAEPPQLTVLACYAAPEGVNAVLSNTENVDLVVGCMAETVDTNGYLVPPTHGDMGDKLFGRVQGS